jgi:alanyl-tRNA synthetase
VLKQAADQKGSLVAPDRLRFDFTSKSAMTPDEVRKTESWAQELINADGTVYTKSTNLAVAKSIQGLRAVFDEVYPDPVRIVSIGVKVQDLEDDPNSGKAFDTSVEFCGGTHLLRAGHIGKFVITSEEAISAGVRRMIAITGPEAAKAIKKAEYLEKRVDELIASAKVTGGTKEIIREIVELESEISHSSISYYKKDDLRNRLKELKKSLDDMDRKAKAELLTAIVELTKQKMIEDPPKPNYFVVAVYNADSNTKALDAALKQVKTMSPSTSALFFTKDEESGKVFCLAHVSPEGVTKGLKANEWVGKVAEVVGGKGGGKADSAQASGSKIEKLYDAVRIAEEFAKLKLSLN